MTGNLVIEILYMKLWVFDNDGTLYDDTITQEQFQSHFVTFIQPILGVGRGEIAEELSRLKNKWDTDFSILAIRSEFGIDYQEILNSTYLKIDFSVCSILNPDQEKIDVISSLDGEKIVLTNNPEEHAQRVLNYTGLLSLFSRIVGMRELGYKGKPHPDAYEKVELLYPSSEIYFFDDSLKNLDAAQSRGWHTIWCRPLGTQQNSVKHRSIDSFSTLSQIIKSG